MKPRLGVIIASTRENRAGGAVADWIVEKARVHGGFDVEVLDLKEIGLPMLSEPNHPRFKQYTLDSTKRWSATVAALDAFVVVTPEYNHGTPPALAWTTAVADGALQLDVRNDGASHAQLTAISLRGTDGTPTPLHPGLLGYVLPGANMHWRVAIPAGVDPANARIEAQVNGTPTELPPPAGALPR